MSLLLPLPFGFLLLLLGHLVGHIDPFHVLVENRILLILRACPEVLIARLVDKEWVPVEIVSLLAHNLHCFCLWWDLLVSRLIRVVHYQVRVSEVLP